MVEEWALEEVGDGDVMPNRDRQGPRKRSPRPSKRRGGRKLGNCTPKKRKK